MDSNEPLPFASMQSTSQTLDVVLQSRNEIASVIAQAADSVTGRRRRQMRGLADWFRRPVTSEDVLRRPQSLSICLPLMQLAQTGTLQQEQIEDAVRRGCDGLHWHAPQSRRMIALLVYPLAILVLCGLILAAICVFLVPEFEHMFNEFGLMLPAATRFLIWVSHQMQDWGLIVLVLLAIICVALLWSSRFQSEGDGPIWSRKLHALTTSTRGAFAAWAWHLGLLIEAGVSQPDAVAVAGRASSKSWLRESSAGWAQQMRGGSRPFDTINFLRRQPCHLLSYAMRSTDFVDQSELLREVAAVYWDRDRQKSYWWLSWFSPVIVLMLGAVVGMVVVALFMPLVSLITGLS